MAKVGSSSSSGRCLGWYVCCLALTSQPLLPPQPSRPPRSQSFINNASTH